MCDEPWKWENMQTHQRKNISNVYASSHKDMPLLFQKLQSYDYNDQIGV